MPDLRSCRKLKKKYHGNTGLHGEKERGRRVPYCVNNVCPKGCRMCQNQPLLISLIKWSSQSIKLMSSLHYIYNPMDVG